MNPMMGMAQRRTLIMEKELLTAAASTSDWVLSMEAVSGFDCLARKSVQDRGGVS